MTYDDELAKEFQHFMVEQARKCLLHWLTELGYSETSLIRSYAAWDIRIFNSAVIFSPNFPPYNRWFMVLEDSTEVFEMDYDNPDFDSVGLAYHRLKLRRGEVITLADATAPKIALLSDEDLKLPTDPPRSGLLGYKALQIYCSEIFYPWVKRRYGAVMSEDEAQALLRGGSYSPRSAKGLPKDIYYLAALERKSGPTILFVITKDKDKAYLLDGDLQREFMTKDVKELFNNLFELMGDTDFVPSKGVYAATNFSPYSLALSLNTAGEESIVLSTSPHEINGFTCEKESSWLVQPWSRLRNELLPKAYEKYGDVNVLIVTEKFTHEMSLYALLTVIDNRYYRWSV